MNPLESRYPDLVQPDSTESRRRIVSALESTYAVGKPSSSVDAAVFETIDRLSVATPVTARTPWFRRGLIGGAAAATAIAAVVALLLVLNATGGSAPHRQQPPKLTVASPREVLNRAAVAFPAGGSVLRLTYRQSVGSPAQAQRVFIWQASGPGGYGVAGSQTASAAANVAEIRLKGRLHRLARPLPILGALDGLGDARMLAATMNRSPRLVTVRGPVRIAGRKVYAFRLHVRSSSNPRRSEEVWFYYDLKSSHLVAASGPGWGARLEHQKTMDFFGAPKLIRQLLRPDVSGTAPAY